MNRIALLVVLLPSLALEAVDREQPVDWYVSPSGKDTCSGTRSEASADGGDGPLATIACALAKARDRHATHGSREPLTIMLRGGVYQLTTTLALSAQDSYTTLSAFPHETPILSGGMRITSWSQSAPGVWRAPCPPQLLAAGYPFECFFDGRRGQRTRLPRSGLLTVAVMLPPSPHGPGAPPSDGFLYASGDWQASWHDLGDVECIFPHFWLGSHLHPASVDEQQQRVSFLQHSSRPLSDDFTGKPGQYWIENVAEELHDPGQWYLDRAAGEIRYLPLPGQAMERVDVELPRLSTIMTLTGAAGDGQQITAVQLQGLEFRYAEQRLAATDAGDQQSSAGITGALQLVQAHTCMVDRCTVRDCGTYGISVGPGCHDLHLQGNLLTDLAAGGITITGGDANSKPSQRTSNIVVTDNDLHALGRYYLSAAGILSRHAGSCVISHNRIHDLYYTGISVGWVWGYRDSVSNHNLVEANDLFDIGQGMLSDMGGIYVLGPQEGTVIRGNRIHDVMTRGYGGWGIYLDEGSSDVLVEDNLVYRTMNGGFHQHYGARNVIRNNIFAYGSQAQLMRSREEQALSFTLSNNIILWNQGDALAGSWKGHFLSDTNCWAWMGPGEPTYNGGTFAAWQQAGHDLHSLRLDPGFTAPAAGDFSLNDTSPVFALGYHRVDYRGVGPRPALH